MNLRDTLLAIKALKIPGDGMSTNTALKLDQLRADIKDNLGERAKSAARKGAKLDEISRKMATLAEDGKRVAQEQNLLQSLTFESMKQREEKIKEAHRTTLGWIFLKSETRLIDWLKTENGIYWVKGKVGWPG